MPVTKQLFDNQLQGLSLSSAVDQLASADTDGRGAIFTRPEVVDFILDLIGYSPELALERKHFLEPSFGDGDFLLPVVLRLFESLNAHDIKPSFDLLKDSVRAVELHADSFVGVFDSLLELLVTNGLSVTDARKILNKWLVKGDFLLTDFDIEFTHIAGNPPYIRQESLPRNLMIEYRQRFQTIYDRADIYIPFYEHSLSLLDKGGMLGFICANRWMKNRYGGPLRKLIANNYHLKVCVDMVGVNAFTSNVIAYPAITIISNDARGLTQVVPKPTLDPFALKRLSNVLLTTVNPHRKLLIDGSGGPWLFDDYDSLNIVQKIEAGFPSLEEVGCKVGIGVASGADKVFIGRYDELAVEDDRKVPLATTKDIRSGEIVWGGLGIINPFSVTGELVDLDDYPRLRSYFETHEDVLRKRHVANKNPQNWYRTIDKINIDLLLQPKLLIPDIKGDAHIVYDKGGFYPHHNLYYITAEQWDLPVLKAVLASGIARLFIRTYSTKMHGDCLRFQAQYLRRIRLPAWESVAVLVREKIVHLSELGDINGLNSIVYDLYNLTESERNIIEKYGN